MPFDNPGITNFPRFNDVSAIQISRNCKALLDYSLVSYSLKSRVQVVTTLAFVPHALDSIILRKSSLERLTERNNGWRHTEHNSQRNLGSWKAYKPAEERPGDSYSALKGIVENDGGDGRRTSDTARRADIAPDSRSTDHPEL